jgi:hypothetical protein
MDIRHKKAIQQILEGSDIKSAAEFEGLLPDTLIKFLTANFQITGNSSVRTSKLFESFKAFRRLQDIDERIERIRGNISTLMLEGATRLKGSKVETATRMLNLLSGLAKTSELEIGALMMESLELAVDAEFYREALG